jgi:autotransporter translocation and assembly factor TamB
MTEQKQTTAFRSAAGRWLLLLLLLFLVPGLAFVGALAWLGNSDAGTRLIAEQATRWVPGLSLELSSGHLASGVQVARLAYATDSLEIEVADLSLRWRASCLLAGKLCIEDLEIAALRLDIAPSSGSGPVRLPEITTPWPVAIEKLRVGELLINTGEAPSTQLADIAGERLLWRLARVSARSLSLSHAQRPYQLRGRITLRRDYPVALQLRSTPGEPLPPLIAQLSGNLRSLKFLVEKSQQQPLVLQGSVNVLKPRFPLIATVNAPAVFEYSLGGKSAQFQRLSGQISGDIDHVALSLEGVLRVPGLEGQQEFDVDISVEPVQQSLVVKHAGGQFLGLPVKMQGELAWSAQRGLQARRASLVQGANSLDVNGELDGAGLEWSLSARALQAYWPELSGKLSVLGRLERWGTGFDLGVSLRAEHIGFQQQVLPLAELDCQWRGEAPGSAVQLQCRNLRLDTPAWASLPVLSWVAEHPVEVGLDLSLPGLTVGPGCLHIREDRRQRVCNTTPLRFGAAGLAAATITGREMPLRWLELLVREESVLTGSWGFSLRTPGAPDTAFSWSVLAAEIGEIEASVERKGEYWEGVVSSAGVSLSPLLPLVPELRKLEGKLHGDIGFRQDERGLLLNGQAALAHGKVGVFEVDSIVEELSLSLSLAGRRASIEGMLAVEDETVELSGQADWQRLPWSAQLRMISENIELKPLEGVAATLSADLTLSAGPDLAFLEGEIVIPTARLDASEFRAGEGVVTLSPDTEIVGREENKVFSGPELNIAVALRLGEDVQFRGYGLRGRLRGGLDLEKKGQRPLQTNGTILLADGEFRAYGQDLIVEEGRLEFTGSPYNPDVRVRAHRRHTRDAAEVGIVASGPIAQPKLRLYSSEPMSEQERMHYLLTGRQIDAANEPLDGAAVSQAAVALGLASTNEKLGKFAEQFGIQNLELGTEQGEQGQEAQVSGYFGPNLYVKYAHSPFLQEPVFSARYRLTEQFYVAGYQGVHSALELLWFVRRKQDDKLYPAKNNSGSEKK